MPTFNTNHKWPLAKPKINFKRVPTYLSYAIHNQQFRASAPTQGQQPLNTCITRFRQLSKLTTQGKSHTHESPLNIHGGFSIIHINSTQIMGNSFINIIITHLSMIKSKTPKLLSQICVGLITPSSYNIKPA